MALIQHDRGGYCALCQGPLGKTWVTRSNDYGDDHKVHRVCAELIDQKRAKLAEQKEADAKAVTKRIANWEAHKGHLFCPQCCHCDTCGECSCPIAR